jgi:uncharacterized protein (TIGR03435 family)
LPRFARSYSLSLTGSVSDDLTHIARGGHHSRCRDDEEDPSAVEKGLKLESEERAYPVFVIDHMEEKPTDN